MMVCYIDKAWERWEITNKYAEQHCSLQKSCEKCKYWKEAGDEVS